MRARDLVTDFPTVELDSSALEAARLLTAEGLPGLIVVDHRGRPVAVLPGTQVLRLSVPRYCQEDPSLARVVDEAHADTFVAALGSKTVRDCLPIDADRPAIVGPRATLLEMATLMARSRSPLVAVVDGDRLLGAVTLRGLLERAVPQE